MNIQKQYKISSLLGIPSCLGLLVLTFLIISPPLAKDVAAESTRTVDSASFGVNINSESVVSIAIDKTEAEANVVPTTSGSFTSQDAIITVQTNNLDGYKLTLTTNNGKNDQPELVNVDHEGVIVSTKNALTGTNLAKNTWGYSIERGTTASDANTEYKAVVNGGIIATTEKITEVKPETYTISFGAKVGADIPAGKYSTIATVSAVANPIDINNLQNLTYMQDMTSEICANTAGRDGATTVTPGNEIVKQLIDVRDGNAYWVAKLADQNCWMTQNLDLDIPAAGLKAVNTDITSDWTDSVATTIKNNNFDIGATNGTYSWDVGDYMITGNTTDTTACSAISSGTMPTNKDCTRLKPYDGNAENAHYLVGNYYQWNAATAGTGGNVTSKGADASGSICPKGWQLPQNENSISAVRGATYKGMLDAYDISNDADKATLEPLYFVRGGYVHSPNLALLGNVANYWSRTLLTTQSSFDRVYALCIAGAIIHPSSEDYNGNRRWYGFTVRCVAR